MPSISERSATLVLNRYGERVRLLHWVNGGKTTVADSAFNTEAAEHSEGTEKNVSVVYGIWMSAMLSMKR